jgi:hypothetical protein
MEFLNKDLECNCPTSYFKSHRQSKCSLNNIVLFLNNKTNNEEIIKSEKI